MRIEVWFPYAHSSNLLPPGRWCAHTLWGLGENEVREKAQRLANERHAYRVVSCDTGREVGRFMPAQLRDTGESR